MLRTESIISEAKSKDEPTTGHFVRPSILVLAISTLATWLSGLLAPTIWALITIAACWIVFGGYVLYRLFQNGHRWLLAMPLLFVVTIAIGVSMPLDIFNWLLDPANQLLKASDSPVAAGKIGHVFCFAVLTFFLLRHRNNWEISLSELFVILALLGIATEGIQLFIEGRTPNFLDFGFDITGVAIGGVVFFLFRSLMALKPTSADKIVES